MFFFLRPAALLLRSHGTGEDQRNVFAAFYVDWGSPVVSPPPHPLQIADYVPPKMLFVKQNGK